LTRGERIIAPSAYVSRAMIKRYALSPERITVVPRAVDTAIFSSAAVTADHVEAMRRNWRIPQEMRVILVSGSISASNGQMTMAEAARLIAAVHSNIAFVFAGDDRAHPRYARSLRQQARTHGVDTPAAGSAIARICRRHSPSPML
jgi:glycosyltransferase involved in cell wall biosynthesis